MLIGKMYTILIRKAFIGSSQIIDTIPAAKFIYNCITFNVINSPILSTFLDS